MEDCLNELRGAMTLEKRRSSGRSRRRIAADLSSSSREIVTSETNQLDNVLVRDPSN